jgi:hypothetical protein
VSGSSALPSLAVFHCRQAAEKAMKGFLARHDVPFRKTHDLEEIGEACWQLTPPSKRSSKLFLPSGVSSIQACFSAFTIPLTQCLITGTSDARLLLSTSRQ